MREAAASIVVGSLESLKPSRDELRFFAKENIPGFVLFKRNISQDSIESLPDQLILPLYKVRNDSVPMIVSIDQEGGRVSRLPTSLFPNEGCAMRVRRSMNNEQQKRELFQYGKTIGEALLKLHINVNFAPVTDILTNPLNTGIGDRAFGMTAEEVISRAGSFLEGMQSTGVWGCLKHFPGQGSELSDPHHEQVVIFLNKEILKERELKPYRELMSLAKMIMISHCIFPSLDSKPASLSRKIITELLKKEMGFSELVFTDDMNMKAIGQDKQVWCDAIVHAVAAGCNAVLVCSKLENWVYAIEAIEREARRSEAFANRLYSSSEKVQNFRRNCLRKGS